MNYMQYMNFIARSGEIGPAPGFLVSGSDMAVRRTVCTSVTEQAFSRGRTLLVADNTKGGRPPDSMGPYPVSNGLYRSVNLCPDLLDVSSLRNISRLRSFLHDMGLSPETSMKIVFWLDFVRETERDLGRNGILTAGTLEKYSSPALVQMRLDRLVRSGVLSEENSRYLLGRYAEISAAAADFEYSLVLLASFMDGEPPAPGTAVYFPLGEISSDPSFQSLLCHLMTFYMKEHLSDTVLLILDDGLGGREGLMDMLRNLPASAQVHLMSRDAFSLPDRDLSFVMERFPFRFYSRHESMESCRRAEDCCGYFDKVYTSYTVSRDRRLLSSSPWDLLFGTDKTETETRNPPVRTPFFRREMIQSLPAGQAIADFHGRRTLISL